MRRFLPGISILLLLTSPLAADDWYRWRGPNLDGISRETDWTAEWPAAGPKVAWKASVGVGFSSVSVADGRLFTMGNQDNTDTVYCLDAASGKELWTHSYVCPLEDRLFEGGPTSTPTVDGDRVYTLSRQGDLFCFETATGNVAWSKNIAIEAQVRVPGWGFGGSPLVHGDLLILNLGEAGTAVQKATGELVWTSADSDAGYTTPLPVLRDGRWIAILASGRYYHAVDIDSGEELWRHRWLTSFGCNAADPIVEGDRLFLSSGYTRGAALLDLSGGQPTVEWENKDMRNQFTSSLLLDEHLYGIDGNSDAEVSLVCMEFSTSLVKWSHLLPSMASLTSAAGKLIVLNEQGELTIAPASPEAYAPTATAKVLTGKCWTVPVLANGRIYCRDADGRLVCVDVRTPE